MLLHTVIIVVLILALIGALPNWPHSKGFGYGPLGIISTLIIAYLILVLLGKL